MKRTNNMSKFVARLLDVPATDPDDARRRKLLNIVLAGLFILAILGIISVIYITALGLMAVADGETLLIACAAFVVGIIATYFINLYWSGLVASSIFLGFFTVLLIFSDKPQEVINGRTLFFLALPIIMASVLLRSYASFILAGLCALALILLGLSSSVTPNLVAMIGFFAIALISWLSSRSLEDALREVRVVNMELDQRVADRTQELSESLSRESEQASQRQAILQGIADGVVVFDNNGKAILANPALTRLVDIPLDQIISHTSSDIFESSETTNEDHSSLLGILSSSNTSPVPMRIRWGQKTLSVSAAPVLDRQNKFIGNVAVFRDFTREAEVEEMKNSFVAMVSHELRTPLNAILGYSEMLRDAYYGQMNDKQTNAADRILNNSRRLLDIVSDLLDKAQIEAGHLNLKVSTFPTKVLTENLHSVMDKITSDRGLTLTSCVAPEMPEEMKGDPERIQQVMINLVNNAAKFTEKGGITVNLYKVADEYWACDVIDTGPGIAPDDQRYIFEPFRQVDKTVTRSHGGIGLGLSIVKRLIDLMGGRIFLKSVIGQGSTFTVVLPFEPLQKGKQA
jgi:PAS domain S-box-containing protein